jgi:lysozyme family protein
MFLKSEETMFEDALRIVLNWEGGYVNDPNDPGGETNFGICKRDFPTVNIRKLTIEQAADIYHQKYWRPCHCDDLPVPIAVCVFDTAVNQGVATASKMLQEALAVTVDGQIGPQTINASRRADPLKLLRDYMVLRVMRYTETKNWNIYGRGWIKRSLDVFQNCNK